MFLGQLGCLLVRHLHDALGLFLCLGDHPLPFLLDLFRLLDLPGNGCPHLVDHVEEIILVDDQIGAQGHAPAFVQQRSRAVDQVDRCR